MKYINEKPIFIYIYAKRDSLLHLFRFNESIGRSSHANAALLGGGESIIIPGTTVSTDNVVVAAVATPLVNGVAVTFFTWVTRSERLDHLCDSSILIRTSLLGLENVFDHLYDSSIFIRTSLLGLECFEIREEVTAGAARLDGG